MLGITNRRPSPALVVAALALLVALSGTAYAATTLPKNSVGTTQLKNGAVTLPKIAASAQGALKPRAWAMVNSDGTILASSGIKGSISHSSGSGIYDLTLSKRATKCAVIASEGSNGGLSYIVGGIAQADFLSTTKLAVHTQYFGAGSFHLSDEDFAVAVYC
jgi:hypothetical protein